MKITSTKSGNPYHNDENGQFEEKDGKSSGKISLDNKDLDNNDLDDIDLDDENDDYDFDIDESLDDLDGEDDLDDDDFDDIDLDDEDDEYNFDIEENKAVLSDEEINSIESLSFGELEESLINVYDDLDKAKIINASEEELKELLKAKLLLKQKDKLVASNEELNKLNEPLFEGLWLVNNKPGVSASDWAIYKDRWQKKFDYFTQVYDKDDKIQKLYDLKKFRELGELYEQSYNELVQSFKEAESFVEKFIDPNYAYSEKRKNNAVWVKTGFTESIKIFGPHADEVLNNLKITNPKAYKSIYFYTGSYSVINEPLRKQKYIGHDGSPYGFVETVKKMSEAIDASTYDFDYWVQRGTSALTIEEGFTINGYEDIEDLNKLVGKTFSHQSFYSAGAGKGTGFTGNNIIINTYCPKGTKGIYMNTQGQYSYGGENEMILQRGYNYKINKIEKHNGKLYMDVDVILNSDKDKYNDEELQELKNKYLSY